MEGDVQTKQPIAAQATTLSENVAFEDLKRAEVYFLCSASITEQEGLRSNKLGPYDLVL